MPISADDLRQALTDHRDVLLVQRSGHWFPDGPWPALVTLEQALVALQLDPDTAGRRLTRVLPYDLPSEAGSADARRFHDWLDVAAITSAIPGGGHAAPGADRGGMTITVYHSTDMDPDQDDVLLVDDDAAQLLEQLRPHLIHPPDDWRDSAYARDHNAYWEGD